MTTTTTTLITVLSVVEAKPVTRETMVLLRAASQSLKFGKLSIAFRAHSYCPR